MASLTRWIWVWVNSRSWGWTGRPGVLQFMGSQCRTQLSDWTELNWTRCPQTPLSWKNRRARMKMAWIWAQMRLHPPLHMCEDAHLASLGLKSLKELGQKLGSNPCTHYWRYARGRGLSERVWERPRLAWLKSESCPGSGVLPGQTSPSSSGSLGLGGQTDFQGRGDGSSIGGWGEWPGPMSESLLSISLGTKVCPTGHIACSSHCQVGSPWGEPDTGLGLTLSAGFLGSSWVPGLPVLWGHLRHSGSRQTSEVILSSPGRPWFPLLQAVLLPCSGPQPRPAPGELPHPLQWILWAQPSPLASAHCCRGDPLLHSNGLHLHMRRGQTLWPGYTSRQCLNTLLTPPLTTSSSWSSSLPHASSCYPERKDAGVTGDSVQAPPPEEIFLCLRTHHPHPTPPGTLDLASTLLPTHTLTVLCLVLLHLSTRFLFFGCCTVRRGILDPWPGIETKPPAMEAQSHNQWTTIEVQHMIFFFLISLIGS